MCYGDHHKTGRDLSINDVVGKLAEDVSARTCRKVGPDRGRRLCASCRPGSINQRPGEELEARPQACSKVVLERAGAILEERVTSAGEG
jgi:hypothetical protein